MHAKVFAGGFGASSCPRSAYPQLLGQPFHACHRSSKAAPAAFWSVSSEHEYFRARQIHRICRSKGETLCFAFEARCEAAQTGHPSFKGRPVHAAVRARLVTRLRVNRFLLFDVCRSTPLFCNTTLYCYMRQNIPSNREIAVYTYIRYAHICITRYSREPCTNPKEPRLFRFVSGWSCCSGVAAKSHRQGADEISFYFVCPIQNKRSKSKNEKGRNLLQAPRTSELPPFAHEECLVFTNHSS